MQQRCWEKRELRQRLRTMFPSAWSRELLAGRDAHELEERVGRGRMAVPVDAADNDGYTTLMRACQLKGAASAVGERMVRVMLTHGADPRKGYREDGNWVEDWTDEFEDDLHAPSVALVATQQAAVDRLRARDANPELEKGLRAWASK